jgi:hypothetical protein
MLCHDPRISNDRSEKTETENPVLIAVELVRQMFPDHEARWEEVVEQADAADWPAKKSAHR